jgi:hypothetical protein
MPETDILNPTAGWDSALGDSMNPSYGFSRKRGSTQLRKKAVGGSPWTRETQNTGHTFEFGWLGRTWACVQRLKQYYEQYEDGYFTIVDHDGGGRHYVGRFTTEPQEVETSNNKYDVQGVTFEEMPQAPMVTYPSDWDDESILFGVTNDRGDQKLATSGAWTQGAVTAPGITLGGILRGAGGTLPLPAIAMNNVGTTVGDWATFEYRGYGFKLWMVTGPAQGKCDLYIDGVFNSTIDCYSALAAAPRNIFTLANLSLDIHDVQIVVDDTQNVSSSGVNIGWYGLQVMR